MSSKVGFQEGKTRNEGEDRVRESFKTNNVCKESEYRHNRGIEISLIGEKWGLGEWKKALK